MGFFEWTIQRERQNCANIVKSQGLHEPNTLQTIQHKDYGKVYIPQESELHGHIFNIHGGGLISGTTEQNKPFCQWLADCGYIVHAIEYPLIPEARFVDQVHFICKAIKENWPQDGKPVYLVADSAGCLLAVIVNAIFHPDVHKHIVKDFQCEEFYLTNLQFDGVWLNCPMLETIGFNEFGIFMARSCFGKKPDYKCYLRKVYFELCLYLPKTTVVIASKYDKLEKQAVKLFQTIGCSLGYGSKDNEKHTHDWNVIYPYMDNWTITLNVWALNCLSCGSSPND